MRTLYTIAYPVLSAADRDAIDTFRRRHDARAHALAAPHYTLLFACDAVAEADYRAHVEAVARTQPAVPFTCRYAMLGAAERDDAAHVFLVPDEGYGALSRLHDALYAGPLEPHLRLDLPFVPHITVGTLHDRHEAKRLCDGWNATPFAIAGRVERLVVGALENGVLGDVAAFDLTGRR